MDNAGESSSKGFEIDLTAQLSDNFNFSATYGQTDAEYDKYIDTVGADRSGERFPFVPEPTFSLQAVYSIPLSCSGNIDLIAKHRSVDDILSGSGVDIDLQFEVDFLQCDGSGRTLYSRQLGSRVVRR